MDADLKREVIYDNYSNPSNRGHIENEEYIYVNTNNSSCIDNIDLWVKLKSGIIEDIKFDGEACAISTASTSIMTKELVGKTIEEVKKFIENFYNMIEEREYDSNILNEALAFDEIYKQANRKTCATLPYKGILDALEKYKNE
ncbi:MAG: SUF system NifU family Fe-S cluster assembly protein [Bacilli bacterium]|nr:SUF system NifU family Fe-S cluster assembly protein [Bacilli bacterium]